MLILALLSDPFLIRLAEATKDIRGTLRQAHDWDHLDQLLRDQPVSVAVVDPFIGKTSAASEVARLLDRWPSIPIIAYSQLTVHSARAFALLSRRGLRTIIIYQFDDNRLRFGLTLRRVAASGIVGHLRNELYRHLAALPPSLAHAVEDLIERPHAFRSGFDLGTASQVPRTTLHHLLHEAGLAPPRQLFLMARVAHAVGYLRDPGHRVQDVAAKLGYTSSKILIRHTMEVLGMQPHKLRSTTNGRITDQEIIVRLLARAQRSVTT